MSNQTQMTRGTTVIANTYGRYPVCFKSGKGVYLTDEDGNQYLDFVAGIAVNALGYGDKGYADALKNQAEELIHVSNLYWNAPNIELSEKLIAHSGMSKVFFCNSGAEANEAGLKFARFYGKDKRYQILTMSNSFHGRTMGALTMTGQLKYQQHVTPMLSGVEYVTFNDSNALISAINENTVGIMIEIIQGEGGIVTVDPEFLKTVTEQCDAHDLLLMIDEVQTGIGRTGHYFAYQAFGLKPDIVSVAKGLGGGFPIGASLISNRVADCLTPSCHASTFGGSALASVAANYILDAIESHDLLVHVREMGDYLAQKLNEMMSKFGVIQSVRGMGLIQGIELSDDVVIPKIINQALSKGLLLVGAGHQVIRFVPPLIIERQHIDEMIEILTAIFEENYKKN